MADAAHRPIDGQARAKYLLECLWTMATWVHRRVETVSFRDDRWATRRVSVDLTVPSADDSPFGSSGPTLVPLTFLRQRQVLRNFDSRDSGGNALPVLTRAENASVHRDMLLAAAFSALGRLDEDVVEAVAARARRGVVEPSTLRPGVASAYEVLGAKDQFTVVNNLLRDQFVLLAWMRARPGDREVAKFCYDEELSFVEGRDRDIALLMGWRTDSLDFPTPAAAFAQSFHFAVNPPPEVRIDTIGLVETKGPTEIDLPEPDVWGQREHLVASGLTVGVMTNVRVAFAARRDGWLQTAVVSAWITFLLLLAGAWGFLRDPPSRDASDAAAAVVIGLAAFLPALLARPGEHALAARLLSGVRLMLAVSAALAIAAGARLAFFDSAGVGMWWLGFAGATLVPALALTKSHAHAGKVTTPHTDPGDPGVRYFPEVRDDRGDTNRG